MKKIILFSLILLTSCSVVKATSQEEAKDLSVLKIYNSRVQIIGELGNPVKTETDAQGRMVDTFSFVNRNK